MSGTWLSMVPVILIEGKPFFAKPNGFYECKTWPGVWFADRNEITEFMYLGTLPNQEGRH